MSAPSREISYEEAKYKGLIEEVCITKTYLDQLKKMIDFSVIQQKAPRVAVDPMYGTARGYLDKLLKGAGLNVTVLHDHRDPYFGGHRPEPSEEYLEELTRIVVNGDYKIGLATDGDADRFGIVDESGEFITPNELLSLAFDYLVRVRRWQGGAARSVATTHLVDRVAKLHGREVYETPVGFKFIGELIAQEKVVIGGEESAGLSIKGHVPEKDGILACLLALEMVCKEGMPLRRQLERLFEKTGKVLTRRVNINLTDKLEREAEGEAGARAGEVRGAQGCEDRHARRT